MAKGVLKEMADSDTSMQSDLGHSISALQENKFIRKKVVFVTQRQAKAFSILEALAERHKITFLKNIIDKQLEYIISVGGRGREDIVTVSKYGGEKRESWTERLLGFAGQRK